MGLPDPLIFTSLIDSYLPEPQASLLNGIIFGIPVRDTGNFYYELKTVGLIHIVVLSGSNITLLAAIITSITGSLGRKTSVVLTIVSIVIFVLFVGPQPPIVRAGFMGVLTLIGSLYGRKTLILYTMLLSLIFIAIFWPEWITGISLQLSYAATLGIVLFGKSTQKNDSHKNQATESSWISYVKEDLRTSLAAQVFTTPIIFYYFKQISFISPISNLLISWLIAPLMIFGLITVVLGKIHFTLGIIFSYVCYVLLTWVVIVVETLAKVPFASVQF